MMENTGSLLLHEWLQSLLIRNSFFWRRMRDRNEYHLLFLLVQGFVRRGSCQLQLPQS